MKKELIKDKIDLLIKRDSSIELNSNFFTNENKLKEKIRLVLVDVYKDIMEDLKTKGYQFAPAFVVLTGSLMGVNYDKNSDLDFHIGVDFEDHDNSQEFKDFLAYYAKSWNQNNYSVLNRSLEVYFQDSKEKHESPGIYDIVDDHWIKHPSEEKINITKDEKETAQNYLEKIVTLENKHKSIGHNRADIKNFLEDTKVFYEKIRQIRKQSIMHDGEKGHGNQVFKLMRRNGALDKLTSLIRDITNDYYDVDNMEKSEINLLWDGFDDMLEKSDFRAEPPKIEGETHPDKPYVSKIHSDDSLVWYHDNHQSRKNDEYVHENKHKFVELHPEKHHKLIHSFIDSVMSSNTRHAVPARDTTNGPNVPRARHIKALIAGSFDVKLNVANDKMLTFEAYRHGRSNPTHKWAYHTDHGLLEHKKGDTYAKIKPAGSPATGIQKRGSGETFDKSTSAGRSLDNESRTIHSSNTELRFEGSLQGSEGDRETSGTSLNKWVNEPFKFEKSEKKLKPFNPDEEKEGVGHQYNVKFKDHLPANKKSGLYDQYHLTKEHIAGILSNWEENAQWDKANQFRRKVKDGTFHPTARGRSSKITTPIRDYVKNEGNRKTNGLDILYHGVGRDEIGANAISSNKKHRLDKYDPYHPNEKYQKLPNKKYDEIHSHYTLNVVDKDIGKNILTEIHDRLSDEGKAIVSVRRDLKTNLKKSEDIEKGEKGDWRQEGYKLDYKPYHEIQIGKNVANGVQVTAHDKGGKQVGSATFIRQPDKLKGHAVGVEESHQRKGLATAMYSLAEKNTNLKIKSSSLTNEGKKFSDSFKKSESYSPKRGDTVRIHTGTIDYDSRKKIVSKEKYVVHGEASSGTKSHWLVREGEKDSGKGRYHRSDRLHKPGDDNTIIQKSESLEKIASVGHGAGLVAPTSLTGGGTGAYGLNPAAANEDIEPERIKKTKRGVGELFETVEIPREASGPVKTMYKSEDGRKWNINKMSLRHAIKGDPEEEEVEEEGEEAPADRLAIAEQILESVKKRKGQEPEEEEVEDMDLSPKMLKALEEHQEDEKKELKTDGNLRFDQYIEDKSFDDSDDPTFSKNFLYQLMHGGKK